MKNLYKRVRGTQDYFSSQSIFFSDIVEKARSKFSLFGYSEVILPILEEEGVFKKGIGDDTDIVDRQIFRIVSEEKDIVLRPEGTAQVVRFFLENAFYKKGNLWKFFYVGPMFRGERPQRGRLRQFFHLGAEVLGSDSVYVDAEIINLAVSILKEFEIGQYTTKINSLGCLKDKERFSFLLKSSLSKEKNKLCPVCKERLKRNPLRILDCKEKKCKEVVKSINIKDDYLCNDCKAKFFALKDILSDIGIDYEYDHYLVRGLDYYTHTVFEIVSSNLGAQNSIGAGGRYNHLVETLGGPYTPAAGFALGMDRILLLISGKKEKNIDVFVGYTSEKLRREAFKILVKLREADIITEFAFLNRGIKNQLKYAQKIKANFVIIVGDNEWKKNCVVLRDMNSSSQENVEIKDLVKILKERVKGHVKNT